MGSKRYRGAYLRRVVGIIGSGVTIFLVWYLFVGTRSGQAIDTLAMFAMSEYNKDFFGWDQILLRELYWFLVIPALALATLTVLFRRRLQLGLRMVVMVGVVAGGVQLLKHWLLTRPALGITFYMTNSYPSGHTAVAAAGAAALVMVAASRWRVWLTHLMAIYLVVIGTAVTVAQWHRPSDVLGSISCAVFVGLICTPIEDDRKAQAIHDREGKRRHLLSASGIGLLISLVGIVLMAWATFDLRASGIGFMRGTATQDLQNLASQHANVALLVSSATVLLFVGFAWFGMGEIGRLSRNRAKDTPI